MECNSHIMIRLTYKGRNKYICSACKLKRREVTSLGRRILLSLYTGKIHKQVCVELGISERTLSHHMKIIRESLQATNKPLHYIVRQADRMYLHVEENLLDYVSI